MKLKKKRIAMENKRKKWIERKMNKKQMRIKVKMNDKEIKKTKENKWE